ncbi:MAG: PadR family transcriptional regulator [Ignisphaera sp.]|nr:PadR family transcriptional regulator [Ignisphaera sp.]MDW8084786.1 PadR family transcriptional regulator [Ignisphaera sp.]
MESIDDIYRYLEEPFLRGVLRVLILCVLKRGELYGYQIYKYVRNTIKSKISLSTFYTVLKELEKAGFIIRVGSRYILTEKGFSAVRSFLSKYGDLRSLLSI